MSLNYKLFCLAFIVCIDLCFGNGVDVKTSSGLVRGQTVRAFNRSIHQFLSIPYARPPTGDLRFAKPKPIDKPLEGIIDGTKIGNSCIQKKGGGFPSLAPDALMSEDCLFLNIWSPKPLDQNSSKLRPVMFWIHGGGLISGTGFQDQYNSSILASHDVVVVTINYRLGIFGFLYSGEDSAPGNVGLFDQSLALKWVRENIHLFGGDKNEITIFGESAGSLSVSTQLLSPSSNGLFKRAILESGAHFFNKKRLLQSPNEALIQSKQIAHLVNCTDSKEWLQCLRKVDANEIQKNLMHFATNPVSETQFLPYITQKAFTHLKFNRDVDVMAGVMSLEGALLSGVLFANRMDNLTETAFTELVRELDSIYHDLNAKEVTKFYLKNVDKSDSKAMKKAFFELYGDILITCPTYHFAKSYAQHSHKSNVYFFQLTYQRTDSRPKEFGVTHGADLDFVFGYPLFKPRPTDTQTDFDFSKEVMILWTNFAKFGNPDNHWPRLNHPNHSIKELNPNSLNHIFKNLFDKTCDGFWKSYY